MKKLIALFCLVFAVMLAGCAATPETPTSSPTEAAEATPEAVTLFDTDTLKIVLEGAETTVTDKATGTEYSYTTSRKLTTKQPTLEQLQARCIARTSVNTDTMEILIAGGLLVITDRTAEQTYYLSR